MSNRPGHPSAAERLQLGEAVLDARASGVRWKLLERRFDRERGQLRRYALEASSGGPRPADPPPPRARLA